MPIIQAYAMRNGPVPPGYWRTREGRLLKLCDMEADHIMNCIGLLETKYYEMMMDMALKAGGNIGLMEEASKKAKIESVMPQYKALQDEIKRRSDEDRAGDLRTFEFEP